MSKAGRFIPERTIVPVLGLNPSQRQATFLGTGFFASDPPLLVTCSHVVRDFIGPIGTASRNHPGTSWTATLVEDFREADLACFSVDGFPLPQVLNLAEEDDIVLDRIVRCFEYGPTTTSAGVVGFSPASRMGNVTRIRNLRDPFGLAGDYMLEMSFPAIKGASGAPIFDSEPPYGVWGIVSQNWIRELLPVQIETIHDEGGGVIEETKFYLPQALAVNVRHVRAMIERAHRRMRG